MPVNKNALIRYKTIDNCLRNHYKRWTIDDLVDACSDALFDMEGIHKGISLRTIQADLQMMRSDKLGYNAPIEVYDGKYYRYANPNYSITNIPITQNELNIMLQAIDLLRELEDFDHFKEMADVLGRLKEKLSLSNKHTKPIIHFDSMPLLKGLNFLNPLYHYIAHKQTIKVKYASFDAIETKEYILYPYLLKEYRNRWFLFSAEKTSGVLYNFALDRITSIEATNEPFKENNIFNEETFFNDVIGVSKSVKDKPVKIIFWADKKESKYVETKPLHSSQKCIVKRCKNGGSVFSLVVIPNWELYSSFMSYGMGIRVLKPKQVVNDIKNIYKGALELYNSNFKINTGKE